MGVCTWGVSTMQSHASAWMLMTVHIKVTCTIQVQLHVNIMYV